MKNVREMVNNIPDTVIEAIKLAGIEYESYIALLDECIAQMDAGLTLQKNVLAVLEAEDYGQDSLDTETLSSLLEQLGTAWSGTMDLYAQLSALQEGQVTKQEEEIKELQEQIADLKKQQEEEQPEGQQGEQPEGQQEEQEEGQQGEQQARPDRRIFLTERREKQRPASVSLKCRGLTFQARMRVQDLRLPAAQDLLADLWAVLEAKCQERFLPEYLWMTVETER